MQTSVYKTKILKDYNLGLISWKSKIQRTMAILSEMPEENLKIIDRSVEINYPPQKSLIQLKMN